MTEIQLTEEQKAFIAECEEEFKDRYTDKDKEFMKIKGSEPKHPPIMDPWYSKPRNYDWSSHDHGGRRNQGSRRRNDQYDRSDRYNDHHHHHNNYKRSRMN